MIPLTVRSYFSLMWGTTSIETLCRVARQKGYTHLALTDTDNLYGLWPFLKACRRENITPIVGAEITDRNSRKRSVCLVKTITGYHHLCRLLTSRHTDESFNLATDLPHYAKDLIVLVKDADLLKTWHESGVQVAAAMPRHPVSPFHPLIHTAKSRGIRLVATPGSFFANTGEYPLHRILRAIEGNTSLSNIKPDQIAPKDAFLDSPKAYARKFDIYPQAISETYAIAEQIDFSGPDFGLVLPPLAGIDPKDVYKQLKSAAYEGAQKRYGQELSESVIDRLEYELQIIEKMGFSPYFLIVQNIVHHSSRICGRGSGAASLVAYCLGITNVCPLKYNLYFERFLNPGRKDPPDIDVDFAWDERDDILATVLSDQKGYAAMVCNHVCFKPRMAIREVAKVFGLPDAEIGNVVKRLPWYWRAKDSGQGLLYQIKTLPEARHLEFPKPWPEILEYARQLIGVPRYLSVHPGGVIITPDRIDHYVPIEKAPKGVPIVQWEKDAAEDAGLVKIDLLGNRSLGVIRDAIANIRANGHLFDDYHWEPEDDLETQQAVAQGQTMGCFYIESPAMRLLQKKTRVGDFEHLVIHSSIIRPAANEFIQEYIRRLHGGNWDLVHPLLGDILEDTFGIMVYQEDVSKVAVAIGGFSHSQADGLRKILSKKDRDRQLRDYYAQFEQGARHRGVSPEQITAIWKMIMSFNGYSFCKPHSASYARVSFQAAYLKVHYPAEFMAAVISNQGGFYSTFAYVSEARRMGLTILPPDINTSQRRWRGNGRAIQVGLMSIKNLSESTCVRIVANRKKESDRNGLYQSAEDFYKRIRPDEPEAVSLIHAGALDRLSQGSDRADLMWSLKKWYHHKTRTCKERLLFIHDNHMHAPNFPSQNHLDRMQKQFNALGFLCECHPMVLYQARFKNHKVTRILDLPQYLRRPVTIAGWLITGKLVQTRQGELMEFLTFEDDTGIVETTFFPNAYQQFCHMLDFGKPYLLTGMVEENWGALTLTVNQVKRIDQVVHNHKRAAARAALNQGV